MPSKKAKDKDEPAKINFETPASTYLRQPEVQIQNTEFDGIVQLSPTFHLHLHLQPASQIVGNRYMKTSLYFFSQITFIFSI